MNWLQANKRSAWIIGLTLLVPVLIYLNALLGLLAVRQEYAASADRLLPRIARLEGLIASGDPIQGSAEKVGRVVANLVYPVTADRDTVSATLQKDVRQILVESGLSVSNSQVLPVRQEDEFDYISLKLTVTGDLADLDTALSALSGYTPLLLVESLDLWPNRGAALKEQPAQTISASLQLFSLRAVQ